jgi:NAD+ kinase
VVVDARERVTVSVVSPREDIRVTVDGQKGSSLKEGERVVIEKSDRTTKLVVPDDYDFFSMLREKL